MDYKVTVGATEKPKEKGFHRFIDKKTWEKVKKYRFIYMMVAPIAIYFLVFSYYPLVLGLFKSFFDTKMMGGSVFVGFENYVSVLTSPLYQQAFVNSVVVGLFTFLLQFVWGVSIALILNEIKSKTTKRFVQSVTYIPYLLSWSIVGGIWIAIFSPHGLVNGVLELFANDAFRPIVFMSEPAFARAIMVFTGAWKGAGYFALLFLAAIVAVDKSVYEAAAIDGASRIRQIFSITVPSIIPTMKVVVVLSAMSLLRNFDQVFIMANPSTYDEVRNLLLLIFQDGITQYRIGLATAGATVVLIATMIISFAVRKITKYDDSYE